MVALFNFLMATLEIVFGRKKLLDGKGPFDDNVFKNPAILLALRMLCKGCKSYFFQFSVFRVDGQNNSNKLLVDVLLL